MADTPSRLFSLVAILIGVWVLVYWLYEPRPPKVTADTMPRVSRNAPPPSNVSPLPPSPQPAAPKPDPRPELNVEPKVEPAPVTPPPVPQPQPPPIIEPKFRQYVVQTGDVSWEAVAQRIFGDRKMWRVISQANPMATSDRFKPGKTVLNIPLDPTNIQGKPNPEAVKPDPPAPTTPATSPDTTYVIQEGDTLWAIAKKVYGKGGLWEHIYEANRDKIKDKDRPIEGTVLRIPAKKVTE